MLLGNIDGLIRHPQDFLMAALVTAVALIVAISVHEFSHAWMAAHHGDYTAKSQGRLTLNPLAHLDPLGTVLLFVVGFGWGKPVPISSHVLLQKGRSTIAEVSFAGPAANFIVAALAGLAVRLKLVALASPVGLWSFGLDGEAIIGAIFFALIVYNVVLGVFNLIPLPPLDGFNIAVGLLPRDMAFSYSKLQRLGPGLLIMVILFDNFFKMGILSRVFDPVLDAFSIVVLGNPL